MVVSFAMGNLYNMMRGSVAKLNMGLTGACMLSCIGIATERMKLMSSNIGLVV